MYKFYRLTFVSASFVIYEAGTSLNWDGDTKMWEFFNIANKDIIFCWVPSHVGFKGILTVRHILVECNHFARERKDKFGRRDVVESLRFHPTLIVIFLQ